MKVKVKDEGLKISKVQVLENKEGEFIIYLERPYYNGIKVNSDITENSFVNLHTVNSISFTKGLVIKKHLIIKEKPKREDENEQDEEEVDVLGQREVNEKRKQRERIYLEFILQF